MTQTLPVAQRQGAPQTYIPLRAAPNVPDTSDADRIALVAQRWNPQDALLAQRDKQVEENVRMLAGRQWEVFSPTLGRFVDVSIFMNDKERAFRQRPVINRLLYWFMLTHARLTENPPVVSFQPSTADRKDAILAEIMDVVFKTQWLETGMLEVLDRLVAWLIPGGSAFLKSRIDFNAGADVQRPITAVNAAGEVNIIGQRIEKEGALAVDVLSPLETRGEWNAKPWHQKRWHIHRSFLPPSDIKTRWNLDVRPDGVGLDPNSVGSYLTRIMFSSGSFGAVEGRELDGTTQPMAGRREDGYVVVDEMWELPCDVPGFQETPDSPGGRLLVVLPNQNIVAWDSPRPYRLRAASPIREFRFVNLPGRPSGTSPQEMLNPIQRAYNRGWAQLLEHRALMSNPIIELDANAGLESKDFVNRPGAVIPVHKRPGVEAFRYIVPPQISGDVWRIQQQLSDVLDHLGNIPGAQGSAPTLDASGELVKELRYNSDRFVGPTSKRMVLELARLIEDWIAILPVAWTTEKVLAYAGADNVVRTLTVLPEMFDGGKVHVLGDIESMLPEGRGERQQKVERLYAMAAFGQPGSPGAIKTFLEMSRFPHLSRTIRPGGVDRVTAEQFLGQMLQGVKATQLPLSEWYDFDVHLSVFEDYMKSPEYLRQPPPIATQIEVRRQMLVLARSAQEFQRAQRAAQTALLSGAVQGTMASGAVAAGPPQLTGGDSSGEPESAATGSTSPSE